MSLGRSTKRVDSRSTRLPRTRFFVWRTVDRGRGRRGRCQTRAREGSSRAGPASVPPSLSRKRFPSGSPVGGRPARRWLAPAAASARLPPLARVSLRPSDVSDAKLTLSPLLCAGTDSTNQSSLARSLALSLSSLCPSRRKENRRRRRQLFRKYYQMEILPDDGKVALILARGERSLHQLGFLWAVFSWEGGR